MTTSLYKNILLDHFRKPRNKGGLEAMSIIKRGSNPRCGDDIEVGICIEDNTLSHVRFHGRGCSVCLASASIMTESVQGLSKQQAMQLQQDMQDWLEGERNSIPSPSLLALDSVRHYSSRKKCVQLAWLALGEALREVLIEVKEKTLREPHDQGKENRA